jgi:hypothetical protein
MLIEIQAKDNQILNDHIIALPWWLYDTNSKNAYIYKIMDHERSQLIMQLIRSHDL